MPELHIAHTADLDRQTLQAARALLECVFEGEMTEDDWEHALGGMHALLWDRRELIGHAAVVQRRLLHDGRTLRAGYVEGVGVRGELRGRGHGAALMAAVERVIRGAYALGALAATEEGRNFYARRGWERWRGPTSALTPAGISRTHDDDGWIYVLPVTARLNLDRELTCDWREGDVW